MLSQLLSTLSRMLSKSQTQSSRPSESSASSPAPSQGSSGKTTWKDKAAKQLVRHEGEVLHAYQDHLGYWTIGIGRLIDKRRGGGISKEEAEFLFMNDVNGRIKQLEKKIPWFKNLDEPRKAVLLNMSFQLGIPGLLQFKNTLAKIEAGDYEGAAVNMMKSKWATQTPRRAQELANQMRTGKWQSGSN